MTVTSAEALPAAVRCRRRRCVCGHGVVPVNCGLHEIAAIFEDLLHAGQSLQPVERPETCHLPNLALQKPLGGKRRRKFAILKGIVGNGQQHFTARNGPSETFNQRSRNVALSAEPAFDRLGFASELGSNWFQGIVPSVGDAGH